MVGMVGSMEFQRSGHSRHLAHSRKSSDSGCYVGLITPMRKLGILTCAFFVLSSTIVLLAVRAENWPNWRGPSLNGVSSETDLPTRWDDTENVTWKIAMPDRSGSTPVIWGETIFLNVAEGTKTSGALSLWALNRSRGEVLWKRPLGTGDEMRRKQNMSSPSPITDGRTVWVMTGTGIIKAFDFRGRELWMRDIQKDYGRFGLNWGYASTPLLYDNSLFVPVLHGMKTDDPSFLLKLDARTGITIWKVERPTPAQVESPDSYITPALLREAGRAQVILSGGDCVTAHDPRTGAEIWRAYGLNPTNMQFNRIVNSPVIGEGMVFAGSRSNPYIAVRTGGRGDVSASHVAWTTPNGPDVATPVTDGRYIYLIRENGAVFAHDVKSGAVVYGPQRLAPGTYSASPILADGKIYVTSEDGVTSVFRTGAKFELLAENQVNGYCLSTIAVSDGQLFLRTDKFLYCVGSRRRR
jgi:outer membrane protein assembly factor BamB